MKKTLYIGDKKLAEFNLPPGRTLKICADEKTGTVKIAMPKRKDVTYLEQ